MKNSSERIITKKTDVDMTEGSTFGHLLRFALPLLVGFLFQQLYNTVDTWVVGNYVSDAAFSAVGTVGPIINTLIGFFLGLSSGAGVVISQYYGAKVFDKVEEAVHTAIVMTLLLGVLFTGLGIAMIPYMLRLINMPAEILGDATTYLTIYFAGVLGLMLYNIGAGILRAVGDSNRPFYFLVISAVINTALDLVFVLVFNMGVEGVAYATILAQGISAILIMLTLMRSKTCVKLSLKKLKLHKNILFKILRVGLPAAIQSAVTSFSNVFVQSYINFFGQDCMGGWTAYSKIDQLILLPMQAVSLASTTFVGQNLGRNYVDRAKKGVTMSLLLSVGSTVLLMIPVIVFAPQIVEFFNDTPGVVEFGARFLRTISPFYVLCCINQIYAGALRGAGNSRACMLIMLGSFVVFRQCYLFVFANFISNTILPISMSYPAGWIVCSTITLIYYKRVNLAKTRVVSDSDEAAIDTAADNG